MIQHKCPLRRLNIPLLPCNVINCDWFVRESDYNNCFWVLSNALSEYSVELSVEEIAVLEGKTEEEIEKMIENALLKCRSNCRKLIKNL
jgi:hypothetical protein